MRKRKNGEGSYGEKTIKGVKYKYYRDVDGHYTYAKTAKELEQKLQAKKDKVIVIDKKMVVSDLMDLWLQKKRLEVTDGTFDDYEQIIKTRIKEYKGYDLGNKQLQGLTVEMVNSYLYSLAQKYSKGTIDKTWHCVKQALEWGIKKKYVPTLDFTDIVIPNENQVAVKKKEVPFIPMDDMEILWNESQKKIYGNGAKVIDFIMYSGLRISEATALKWKNVASDYTSIKVAESSKRIVVRDKDGNAIKDDNGNMKRKYIDKTPKTDNSARTVPLPERAVKILQYFEQYRTNDNDFVFVTKNKTMFNRRNLQRVLEKMLENSDCSCKDYSPHSLRHGYGSVLISNGVDIKIVSELLGHTDVAFTYNVYIGVLKADKINAVNNVFNTKKDTQ